MEDIDTFVATTEIFEVNDILNGNPFDDKNKKAAQEKIIYIEDWLRQLRELTSKDYEEGMFWMPERHVATDLLLKLKLHTNAINLDEEEEV